MNFTLFINDTVPAGGSGTFISDTVAVGRSLQRTIVIISKLHHWTSSQHLAMCCSSQKKTHQVLQLKPKSTSNKGLGFFTHPPLLSNLHPQGLGFLGISFALLSIPHHSLLLICAYCELHLRLLLNGPLRACAAAPLTQTRRLEVGK